MRSSNATVTSRLIASSGDISLIIDKRGRVRDLGFGSDRETIEAARDWIGKPWIDTVTVESRPKIEALLKTTEDTAPSPWRQVNHPSDTGLDIPVMYRALARDTDDHLIVVGRDLRQISELQQQLLDAQHSMEREYALLQQAETRYRMLFTLASEGVLIIDADSRRILEANPAAGEVLGRPSGRLVGRIFPRGFTEQSEDEIEELLAQVRASGSAEDIAARLDGSERDLRVGATLLRRDDGLFYLVRMTTCLSEPAENGGSAVMQIVQRSPDAFVVTDPDGKILSVNATFVELCQLGSEQQALGQPLDRWIGRAGVDVDVLRRNLRQRSQVKQFATTLNPEFGDPIDAELSAVAALDSDPPVLGFVIRPSFRPTNSTSPKLGEPLAHSLQDMTELIGRVPLKELVRDTSDIIERMCIEAALKITNDNRASAADLLGLSRQSLYVKLRRYGFGDSNADNKGN
jgi:transcriptional regulator PpsR